MDAVSMVFFVFVLLFDLEFWFGHCLTLSRKLFEFVAQANERYWDRKRCSERKWEMGWRRTSSL